VNITAGSPTASTLQRDSDLGEYERLDRESIVDRQRVQLAAMLRRVYDEVPFYRTALDECHLDPREGLEAGALQRLPLINKATLRTHQRELYVADDPIDFVSSSGTAGEPIILPVRRIEEPLRVVPIRRVLQELGLGRGDRVLHNFNMFALYVIGYYSALALREQGCALIRTGPSMEERQIDVIRQLQPVGFVGNPFFMLSLADIARRCGLEPRTASLRKGLLATATPFDASLQPRETRRQLEETWNLELTITHYGSSEVGPIGYECRHHQGYHVHEDIVFAERLDPQTLQPVAANEVGELVITHLDGQRGFTAIRFRTGDLIAWTTTDPCACGRRTLRLGPVIGRVDQQLKLRGQNIVPDFLLTLIDGVQGVSAAVIEAFRREDTGEDWFRVKIGVEDIQASDTIKELVRAKIAAHIPTQIPIDAVPADLVRAQQRESAAKTGGNKVSRFFDRR
jgi:phenylacetate-CoA ligase